MSTLIATEAAKKEYMEEEKKQIYADVAKAIETILIDKIAAFLSKTAVEKIIEKERDQNQLKEDDNKILIDDYILTADPVKQGFFRGSSEESDLFQEKPENGDDHNLVEPEEHLNNKKTPILKSVTVGEVKSEGVTEEKQKLVIKPNMHFNLGHHT